MISEGKLYVLKSSAFYRNEDIFHILLLFFICNLLAAQDDSFLLFDGLKWANSL